MVTWTVLQSKLAASAHAGRAWARVVVSATRRLALWRLWCRAVFCGVLAVSAALPLAAASIVLGTLTALVPSSVQAGEAPPDVGAALDKARDALEKVQKALSDDKTPASALSDLRDTALAVQSQADTAVESLQPHLTNVQARLAELGVVNDGDTEASDIAARRTQLEKSRNELDSQLKLARLLSIEAGQAVENVSTQRRSDFQAQLGERTASILSTAYWSEFRGEYSRDGNKLTALGREFAQAIGRVEGIVWFGMLVAVVALMALRMWAGHRLMKITATRVPSGRLRRSFHALTLVLLGLAVPGLIAELLNIGLTWRGALPDELGLLVGGTVSMVCFGGYVAGLGGALLSPYRSSWRLPPIVDAVASRMKTFPFVFAITMVMTWLMERVTSQINASLTTAVAVNCVVALSLGGLIGAYLIRFERVRRDAYRDPDSQNPLPRPLWMSVIIAAVWIVLICAALLVLGGYVALGSFIVKQTAWTLVVLSSVYLFSVLAEDVFMTLLATSKTTVDDDAPVSQFKAREQAAVLLSGATRVVLCLFAFLLLLAPFGAGPFEMYQRVDQLRGGISVGEVNIRPGSVAQALLVLGLTLLAVKLFKGWLSRRYLPTTQLDPGMQTSASTLFGYAGVVLAIALSLSAVGIGLERVAWVASALSVGIGFGLQAVVQNFVSGLILLAERPVKVGDWVALGGVEGDIVRVNVRATEIQMADRSTVIVPNSEFITKAVRNVTHASPLGLVQIKLPVPLAADAEQVRELILQAFLAHSSMLETPAPAAHLDGIDTAGNLLFSATGYVSSPRLTYGVRSALLFDILARLRAAQVEMYKPAAMIMSDRGADTLSARTSAPREDTMFVGPLLPSVSAAAPER